MLEKMQLNRSLGLTVWMNLLHITFLSPLQKKADKNDYQQSQYHCPFWFVLSGLVSPDTGHLSFVRWLSITSQLQPGHFLKAASEFPGFCRAASLSSCSTTRARKRGWRGGGAVRAAAPQRRGGGSTGAQRGRARTGPAGANPATAPTDTRAIPHAAPLGTRAAPRPAPGLTTPPRSGTRRRCCRSGRWRFWWSPGRRPCP